MSQIDNYAAILRALNSRWTPHAGQVPIGKAVFGEGVRKVFLSCGRQFGKTEFAIYSILRYAATNPDSMCLYVGPKQKQVEDITWQRFMRMLPPELKANALIGNREIHFPNGAVIYVRGSNEPDALRGITPQFVVYEEFKDFNPRFHDDICGPAIEARNAKLLIIGTPPEEYTFFVRIWEEFKTEDQSEYRCFEGATLDNPHNNRKNVLKEIAKLRIRGEEAKIQREYYGRFVRGGAGSVFPMFSPEKHVRAHELIMKHSIEKDRADFEWHLMADPGTTTVFGALIIAIHPYTKHVYVLDEIYERDQAYTGTMDIWPLMQEKCYDLYPGSDLESFYDWEKGYDEAAAWFANEMMRNFGISFEKTEKALNKPTAGFSIIKALLNLESITISDRCENLIREIQGLYVDERGKVNRSCEDHLVDCLRYTLHAAKYDINETVPPSHRPNLEGRKLKDRNRDRSEADELEKLFSFED